MKNLMQVDVVHRRRAMKIALPLVVLLGGCAGNSGSNSATDTTEHYDVPVSLLVSDVPVTANAPSQFTLTYDIPVGVGALTELSVDLDDTLRNTTFTLPAGPRVAARATAIAAASAETVEMRAWIAAASDAASACQSGVMYGPFAVSVSNSSTLDSVSPNTASATPTSLSVINRGAFSLCLEVVSPVAATFSVDSVAIDVTKCDEDAANIAGMWSGQYSCSNIGCGDDSGNVTLTITQDEHSAHYTDDSATYDGTVCGRTYRFDGGAPGLYDENGTFTLGASGTTATKTSTWSSLTGICYGTCTDTLQRQ